MKFSFSFHLPREAHVHAHRTQLYVSPIREWTLGLVVAGVMFVAGALASVYAFQSQQTFDSTTAVAPQSPLHYDEKGVRDVSAQYHEKEAVFAKLREDTSYLPVPVVEVIPPSATEVTVPEESIGTTTIMLQ